MIENLQQCYRFPLLLFFLLSIANISTHFTNLTIQPLTGEVLTFSGPLLLRHTLPSQLRNRDTLQSVFFILIPSRQPELLELPKHVFDRSGLARVVGCENRSFQTLSQDLVAEAGAGGVECCVEDGGLELRKGQWEEQGSDFGCVLQEDVVVGVRSALCGVACELEVATYLCEVQQTAFGHSRGHAAGWDVWPLKIIGDGARAARRRCPSKLAWKRSLIPAAWHQCQPLSGYRALLALFCFLAFETLRPSEALPSP